MSLPTLRTTIVGIELGGQFWPTPKFFTRPNADNTRLAYKMGWLYMALILIVSKH
jgi:hypothetical protein